MHAYASRCFSRCRNRHHRVVGDQQQIFTVCTVWTRHTSLYRLSLRPDCMKKRHPVLLTKLLLCKTDVIIRHVKPTSCPMIHSSIRNHYCSIGRRLESAVYAVNSLIMEQ